MIVFLINNKNKRNSPVLLGAFWLGLKQNAVQKERKKERKKRINPKTVCILKYPYFTKPTVFPFFKHSTKPSN